MYIYIQTYIQTCTHTYTYTYKQTKKKNYMHAYIHAYKHTYNHRCQRIYEASDMITQSDFLSYATYFRFKRTRTYFSIFYFCFSGGQIIYYNWQIHIDAIIHMTYTSTIAIFIYLSFHFPSSYIWLYVITLLSVRFFLFSIFYSYYSEQSIYSSIYLVIHAFITSCLFRSPSPSSSSASLLCITQFVLNQHKYKSVSQSVSQSACHSSHQSVSMHR